MPLFMVKRRYFAFYETGEKDVELTTVKPQWKNSQPGDIATIQCGRNSLKRQIKKIHSGTLAELLTELNFQRIFPDTSNIVDAHRMAREIYPDAEVFMAFEFEPI